MKIEFKDTEIGRIPKDWEVVRLGDICIKITDGTHKTPKYQETGIPFLSTQNLIPFRNGFDFSQYKKYISLDEHKELIKRCKPEKGDILISKCGTIGRTKLIDVDYEFSIFVGLALLKLRKDRVEPRYLEQLLNFQPYVRQMEVASPGATRKTLTIAAIEKLTLPLPPLPEQKKSLKFFQLWMRRLGKWMRR
jgi:type I restriction enzyme S subunit